MINLTLSTEQAFILKYILNKHISIYDQIDRKKIIDIITKINDISITTNEQIQSDDFDYEIPELGDAKSMKKGTVFPTHTNITLDVDIPKGWTNVSYHNDVCPSFSYKGLQIFLCDEATRKAEGFGEKYTIIIEEKYGEGEDPLLATNDWNEVLNFVNNYNA